VGALTCGEFHIEGHVMSVVAVDGIPVEPKNADTIVICTGQRYDVVVTGKTNPLTSVNYIAKMTTDMLTQPPPPDTKLTAIGKLIYRRPDGRNITINPALTSLLTPLWNPPAGILDDTTLVPADHEPLFRNPNNKIFFQTNQTYYQDIGTRISVGPQPWISPKVPSLYTALSTGKQAFNASNYGPGVVPEIIRTGDTVQIYMENPQPWPHPMHKHGYNFQVAGRGIGVWDGLDSSLDPVPMRRDTGPLLPFPLLS
jgi:iron transport multicopper oxidase